MVTHVLPMLCGEVLVSWIITQGVFHFFKWPLSYCGGDWASFVELSGCGRSPAA